MRRRSLLVLAAAISVLGCEDGGVLVVEVRTDLAPGVEFLEALVIVDDGTRQTVRAMPQVDWTRGVRVLELDTRAGQHLRMKVSLEDGAGAVVTERSIAVRTGGAQVVSVVLSRTCRGVRCAADFTCNLGSCVPESCYEQNPSACGAPECTSSGGCESPVAACARAVCTESGACWGMPVRSMCGSDAWCDARTGCFGTRVPNRPDDVDGSLVDASSPDASMPDAATPPDASIDPCRGALVCEHYDTPDVPSASLTAYGGATGEHRTSGGVRGAFFRYSATGDGQVARHDFALPRPQSGESVFIRFFIRLSSFPDYLSLAGALSFSDGSDARVEIQSRSEGAFTAYWDLFEDSTIVERTQDDDSVAINGDWSCVEYELLASVDGTGIVRVWRDGRAVLARSGPTVSRSEDHFELFGAGIWYASAATTVDVDEVVVRYGGERIGCLP